MKKQIVVLEKEIPFLEEDLEILKEKHKELKMDKTKGIEPTNEIVSLKEQNEEREELWKQKINLIEFYYENKERFQQSYQEGTLEALLKNYSTVGQETIQRLLEKENRKQ